MSPEMTWNDNVMTQMKNDSLVMTSSTSPVLIRSTPHLYAHHFDLIGITYTKLTDRKHLH